MFARVLSWLFPPRLPRRLEDWPEPVKWEIHEQGWAGNVQRHYRDGIERHWAEQDAKFHRRDTLQWHLQMLHAEKQMAAIEQEMRDQGYVNTIHDCWEKMDDLGPLQQRCLAGPQKKT
jgi:hypothetical protein